mgnify:CR=1 FL=1
MQKGELVNEGKTKIIFEVEGDSSRAVIEYKNAITAFDNPDFTQEFDTKAKHSNTTTCRIFEMLKDAGVPVAYERQLSETEFLAPKCKMIPLEVVARRYAVGSYLKRHPELAKSDGEDPHRFDDLKVEFFLKTGSGELKMGDRVVVDGLDPKAGEEDPFIINPDEDVWNLKHPKKQAEEEGSDLGKQVSASDVLLGDSTTGEMEQITKDTFHALENFWNNYEFKLIDFKIEFGITADGELMVADVIDNDSWRLRNKDWEDISKQSFRDGESLDKIADKYELVATLLDNK